MNEKRYIGPYWDGEKHTEYPPLVEAVAKAIWESFDKTRDPHTRAADPWTVARLEPRYGTYEAAIAAIRVIDPSFKLLRFDGAEDWWHK
jgi:hypothetical protein